MFGLLVSLGCWVVSSWLFARALTQARRLMDADRFAEARQWLVGVPLRWSSSSEVAYRLGVCEHAGGNFAGRAGGMGASRTPLELGRPGRPGARPHAGRRPRPVQRRRGDPGQSARRTAARARRGPPYALGTLLLGRAARQPLSRLLEASWNSASDPIMRAPRPLENRELPGPSRKGSVGGRPGHPRRS